MKVTFFDTETTGLVQSYKRPDRDRVIELYMVQYEYDGKVHTYHPDFLINGKVYEVKGD